MNEDGRRRARRAMGLAVALDGDRLAVRGRDPGSSLEIHAFFVVGDGDPYALVSLYGHAEATQSTLDMEGLDSLIDELIVLRSAIEDRL